MKFELNGKELSLIVKALDYYHQEYHKGKSTNYCAKEDVDEINMIARLIVDLHL